MTPLEQCRVHVLDALQGLKEAHHALADDQPAQAAVRIEAAQRELTAALAILSTQQTATGPALNSQFSTLS